MNEERKPRNTWDGLKAFMERIAKMPGDPLLGKGSQDSRLRKLRELSKSLKVERNARSEAIKPPSVTLNDGGGDIDDVLVFLAAACQREGIGWRFQSIARHEGRPTTGRLWLEVQHKTGGGGWKQLGPEGVW